MKIKDLLSLLEVDQKMLSDADKLEAIENFEKRIYERELQFKREHPSEGITQEFLNRYYR